MASSITGDCNTACNLNTDRQSAAPEWMAHREDNDGLHTRAANIGAQQLRHGLEHVTAGWLGPGLDLVARMQVRKCQLRHCQTVLMCACMNMKCPIYLPTRPAIHILPAHYSPLCHRFPELEHDAQASPRQLAKFGRPCANGSVWLPPHPKGHAMQSIAVDRQHTWFQIRIHPCCGRVQARQRS